MTDHFNIVDLFFQATRKNPGKTAIVYKNKAISFGALQNQVIETAHYFSAKGIVEDDRVLILVPMGNDLYRIVLALFKIGATAVFIDEWISLKRLQQCCKVVSCKAMIGVAKARLLALFASELKKIPIKLGVKYVKNNSARLNTEFTVTKKSDTALITFTTGSTGTPKAAKRTHAFLYHQFNALIQKIKPLEDDIDMPVLPIVLLINLGTGTTSVITAFKASKPNALKPEKIIDQIRTHSVNRITASPFFIKEIAKYLLANKISIDSLRNIITGGAPVFPNEARLYVEAFPSAKIEIIYGSTEAEPISAVNAKELIQAKHTVEKNGLMVGRTDENIQVKIIKITDKNICLHSEEELLEITLPVMETGEIIVKGDHVLTEYYNNAEALRRNKIFTGNSCWHRTGDSGRLDENGVLYLMGRCDTLIEINGKKLSPYIYEHYFESIKDVAIGTIILLRGNLTAVIELKTKAKKELIADIIKGYDHQIKEIIFMKRIPRDPRHNSKIDYIKMLA